MEREKHKVTNVITFNIGINLDELASDKNIAGLKVVFGDLDTTMLIREYINFLTNKVRNQIRNEAIDIPYLSTEISTYDSYEKTMKLKYPDQNVGSQQTPENNLEQNRNIEQSSEDNLKSERTNNVLTDEENILLNKIAQEEFELISGGSTITKLKIKDNLSETAKKAIEDRFQAYEIEYLNQEEDYSFEKNNVIQMEDKD